MSHESEGRGVTHFGHWSIRKVEEPDVHKSMSEVGDELGFLSMFDQSVVKDWDRRETHKARNLSESSEGVIPSR